MEYHKNKDDRTYAPKERDTISHGKVIDGMGIFLFQTRGKMRNLTQQEIYEALADNGEEEEGCIAIETTIGELANLGASTLCGITGNNCFQTLADKGYDKRKCRGWYDLVTKDVCGMFHIKIQTDKTAEKISSMAGEAGGSLRYSGDSLWNGFKEFEIE